MKNFKQPGDVLTFTAPTGGVVGGTPLLIGALLVVPSADVAQTLPFEGRTEGVFSYTKIASQAWAEGAKIYWDTRAVGAGGQRFTTDATQGPLVGNAVVAVGGGAGETTGVVRLNGSSSALLEGGPEAAVPDLVDNSGGAAADGTIAVVTAPTALIDNTTGVANTTLAAITNPDLSAWNGATDPSAAQATAIGAAVTSIKNSIAQFAASQAQDRAALVALTDAVKELSTKQNALLASLRLNGIIS